MALNLLVIEKVEKFVKSEMDGVCSAHDFFHIERVVKLAKKLQKMEGDGDLNVIIIGALMHESLDDKFFDKTSMTEKTNSIKEFLSHLNISKDEQEKILFIVQNVGFGKSLERGEDFTAFKEFEIVEDADRLESVGAIAIARTFAYGGKKKMTIYDPEVKPAIDLTREKYTKSENTSINHFYEKLLLLKDMMHTDSGKSLAQERHSFMEKYLDQFFSEWNVDS